MQGFKEFYEEVSKNKELKNRLDQMVEEKLEEARKSIIKDYISIAKENSFELTENDFSKSAMSQQDGISGGCFIVDSGCFIGGEINDHGGCIVIGMR